MLHLYELEGIVNNGTTIELYVDNSPNPLLLEGDQEFPYFMNDFEVTDIYGADNHTIICLNSEWKGKQ